MARDQGPVVSVDLDICLLADDKYLRQIIYWMPGGFAGRGTNAASRHRQSDNKDICTSKRQLSRWSFRDMQSEQALLGPPPSASGAAQHV